MSPLPFQYFCYECKLFDDEDKAQFHCDGCGICRIGGRENFFHCVTCNMCLPTHLEGKHKVSVIYRDTLVSGGILMKQSCCYLEEFKS